MEISNYIPKHFSKEHSKGFRLFKKNQTNTLQRHKISKFYWLIPFFRHILRIFLIIKSDRICLLDQQPSSYLLLQIISMACNISKCISAIFVILYIFAQLTDLFCQDSSTGELCLIIIIIFCFLILIMIILGILKLFQICIRRCRNRHRDNQAYHAPLLVDDINYQPSNQINQSVQYYQPSVKQSENLASYRETFNQVQCSVCLQEFTVGEKLGRLTCGHKFHSNCIQDWADRHRTCPVCRVGI